MFSKIAITSPSSDKGAIKFQRRPTAEGEDVEPIYTNDLPNTIDQVLEVAALMDAAEKAAPALERWIQEQTKD